MDALDLTTGERLSGHKFLSKGSRRKAAAPQRRQHSDGENGDELNEKQADSSDASTTEDAYENNPDVPPRPSSEGDARDVDLCVMEKEPKIALPIMHASPNILGDFAQKILEAREKLLQFDPRRQFPLNLNNNSNSPADSPGVNTVDSSGSLSDPRPSSVPGELPLSLLATSRGLAMDDLMQQRLRRYLDDVQPAEAPGIPERTKKQNRWAFNVWREWARKRNALEDSFIGPHKGVPLDVGQATEEELNYWLCKFVVEIRRKDGHPYPPHTLMQIVMGIQRYLRQQAGKPTICILDRSNATYSKFRSVLDFRIKELTNNGATSMKTGSRPVLYGDVESKYRRYLKREPFPSALERGDRDLFDWKASIMNTDTAQGLLNAVFWNNYKTFGIQYIDDHWNLRAENFEIHSTGNGESSILEFTPTVPSMTASGGKANGTRVMPKKIYSDSPGEREIFLTYQKYLAHIPSSGPFYRHPVDPTIVDRSIKFSDQWVGKNRLRAMLKHLIDIGGPSGRTKSPYSASSRHSSGPSVDTFVTPMMQLTSLPTRFTSPPVRENVEIMKPLMQIPQLSNITTKEMDDESCDDSNLGPPSPKRRKSENSGEMKNSITSGKGSNSKTSNTSLDDEALEIAVPKTIKSITVIKGGRKITFQLD